MKHLRNLFDITPDDFFEILDLSTEIKSDFQNGIRKPLLERKILALIFEKPSLRTRNSFEAAMMQLGGGSLFLTTEETGMNGRESTTDIAKVIGGYSDFLVLRTFSQQLIDEFASHACCPVVNALSDEFHPCQALTDMLTIRECLGTLAGKKIVYLGDSNNVAASLAIASAMTNCRLHICGPEGYEFSASFLSRLQQEYPVFEIEKSSTPSQAVTDADVIYTDVWASMGQEAESQARKQAFADFRVDVELMRQAPPDCLFLHPLPAHRGEEVTDDVIDGPQSQVFAQANNRMHIAKGLLVWLASKTENNSVLESS